MLKKVRLYKISVFILMVALCIAPSASVLAVNTDSDSSSIDETPLNMSLEQEKEEIGPENAEQVTESVLAEGEVINSVTEDESSDDGSQASVTLSQSAPVAIAKGESEMVCIQQEAYVLKPINVNKKDFSEVEENTEEDVPEVSGDYITMTVTATAYCPCQKCCGIYALNRPKDEFGNDIVYNASGNICKPNHTISVDPSVIPYGTVVKYGDITWVAEDCGGGVKGNHIDIYFATHEEALNWGRRTIDVNVYI